MSTVNRMEGKNVVIVKGAFDVMADRCVRGDLDAAKEVAEAMSESALRVLALAYKEIDKLPDVPKPEELEKDLSAAGPASGR